MKHYFIKFYEKHNKHKANDMIFVDEATMWKYIEKHKRFKLKISIYSFETSEDLLNAFAMLKLSPQYTS